MVQVTQAAAHALDLNAVRKRSRTYVHELWQEEHKYAPEIAWWKKTPAPSAAATTAADSAASNIALPASTSLSRLLRFHGDNVSSLVDLVNTLSPDAIDALVKAMNPTRTPATEPGSEVLRPADLIGLSATVPTTTEMTSLLAERRRQMGFQTSGENLASSPGHDSSASGGGGTRGLSETQWRDLRIEMGQVSFVQQKIEILSHGVWLRCELSRCQNYLSSACALSKMVVASAPVLLRDQG